MKGNTGVLKILSVFYLSIFSLFLASMQKTFQSELFRVTNLEFIANSNNKMYFISHLFGQPTINILHKMSLVLIERMIHALYRQYIWQYNTVK